MSPLAKLKCPLVLDVSSFMNMEGSGCTESVLRVLPVPCLLAMDAKIELESLGVGVLLQAPLFEVVEMQSEAEALGLVALAAQCLSNAEAGSIVVALSQKRALVTDDRRIKFIASQIKPTLKTLSSLDLIEYWRTLPPGTI